MITSGGVQLCWGVGEIYYGQIDHQLIENNVGPRVLTWIFYEVFLFDQARGSGVGVLLPEDLFGGGATLQVFPV